MQMTFVCLFFFAILAVEPKHGDIKGCQYLINKISGLFFLIIRPVFIQLNGLIELRTLVILIFSGGGFSVYWVFPGNKNPGY